jgi:hypothetical protein
MFQPVTTETPWFHDGDTMVPSGERSDFPDTAFPMDEDTERAIIIALLFTGWAVMVVIRHLLIPAAAALVATVWPRQVTPAAGPALAPAPDLPAPRITVAEWADANRTPAAVATPDTAPAPDAVPVLLQPRTRRRRGSA